MNISAWGRIFFALLFISLLALPAVSGAIATGITSRFNWLLLIP